MFKVTGTVLKKQGEVIATDEKKSVIKWVERTYRKRVFHYLVHMHGVKYSKPCRLKPYEIDYWIDSININNKVIKDGRQKNN